MTLITTTATATATGLGRVTDRNLDGTLWVFAMVNGTLVPEYSKDNGVTWTPLAGLGGLTDASVHIDLDDNVHVVGLAVGALFAGAAVGAGNLIYARGVPNPGRTAWTWTVLDNVLGSGNAPSTPDVVAFRDPANAGQWKAAVVAGAVIGGTNYAVYWTVQITAAGALSLPAGHQQTWGPYGVARGTRPRIDFQHTGDGRTISGAPHLFVAWNAGATGAGKGIRFRKGVYAAGAWTWNAERGLDDNRIIDATAGLWQALHFDGTRAVITGQLVNGANLDVVAHERDAADTTTTTRVLLATAAAADRLYYGTAAYDAAGNVHLVGRDASGAAGTRLVNSRKWTRAAGTLGAVSTIDATGPDAPYLSTRRGYVGQRIDTVRVDKTASPFDLVHDAVLLNVAPNAPASLNPASGTVDRTAIQRLSWAFSDPDAGDTQSAFDLQWRLGAGAWNPVSQATPNAFYDAPAGTFPAGAIEWQVRTYDAAGIVGPWAASAFFTAATPPAAPAIVAPVNGSVVASNTTAVSWTTPGQEAYEVRTVADNAGAPNTGVIYTDTGVVVDAGARTRSVGFAVNNRYEHVQVRIRNNGLWSTWASVRVQISFTPPPVPTVVTAPSNAQGAIVVTITNPAPAAGEPALAYNDLLRRVAGSGDGVRIGTGLPAGAFTDRTPASGVTYEYLARAVAVNGTTRDSAWTA